jgi:hypothetical protein
MTTIWQIDRIDEHPASAATTRRNVLPCIAKSATTATRDNAHVEEPGTRHRERT